MSNEKEQRMDKGTQNVDIQKVDIQKVDTQDVDGGKIGTQNVDIQKVETQDVDGHKIGTQNVDAQMVQEELSGSISEDNLGFVTYLEDHLELNKLDLRTFSPLTLAYIGDCIYEVVIRTILVHDGNAPVNKLHKRASNLVKASAQKEIYQKIREELTEEEMSVFKRGRNAKSFTSAKNATIGEYRIATGFEALMGYLYLDNRMNRLIELVKKGLEKE